MLFMSRSKDKIILSVRVTLDCRPLPHIHVHPAVISVEDVVVATIVVPAVRHQSLHIVRTVVPGKRLISQDPHQILDSSLYLMLTQGSS